MLSLLMLVLVTSGCDGGGAARDGAHQRPVAQQGPRQQATGGGLVARFDPASVEIATTTNARVTFVVKNEGPAPATIDLDALGSAILGLEFFDDDGQPVHTIPPGMPPAGYTPRTETLAPGAEHRFTVELHVFSPPLPEGDYTARVRVANVRSETLELSVDPGGP